jgi:peroxiredoxin Q/BCP
MNAPEFSLPDETGTIQSLSQHKGKWVILYFYPKDDTPGCTKEACSFRDSYGAFKAAGFEVYGLSPNTIESHVKFREKYGLPFRLLVDPDHKVAEALGAWGEKNVYGKTSVGILRTTFVVGPDGTIQRVYPKVKPEEHATQILNDLGVQANQTAAS